MSRPFFDTLRDLRKGATLEELRDKMAELVQDVRMSGKPGKLQLTLTVKPASRGNTSAVMVGSDIQIKKPKVERGEDVFFTTSDNGLVKQDPNQGELPLSLVPVGANAPGSARIDPTTGEIIQ